MVNRISDMELDRIYEGDCDQVLKTFPDSSVDLIFTSPPYADNRRKSAYAGVPADNFVDWFMPIASELKRILKQDGSFVLNIKERASHGERQTYVLELILSLRKQGWLWIEEYIWYKKNCYPGKWPNRFRDAWERCLHFSKSSRFKMFQESVMVPMGGWADKRLSRLSDEDRTRHESKVSSGLGRNVSNWVGRKMAYPTNVLCLPTECSNRNHSAAFPKQLPSWFIKLFTLEDDVVLDPFMGSGTTALACIDANRHFIGVEVKRENVEIANAAIATKVERRLSGLLS